jgi:hypothetical protein
MQRSDTIHIAQPRPLARLASLVSGRLDQQHRRTEAEGVPRAGNQPLVTRWRRGPGPAGRGRWSRWPSPGARHAAMDTALRIDTGVLAGVFLLSSSAKLFVPKEKLATVPLGGWTADARVGFVKALGVVEALAAAGLVLPAAFHVAPVLVPLDAVGIELLMLGAMTTHFRRHEPVGVALNVAYFTMAAFVAWGRFRPQALRR